VLLKGTASAVPYETPIALRLNRVRKNDVVDRFLCAGCGFGSDLLLVEG
jgi:hypothetical protein